MDGDRGTTCDFTLVRDDVGNPPPSPSPSNVSSIQPNSQYILSFEHFKLMINQFIQTLIYQGQVDNSGNLIQAHNQILQISEQFFSLIFNSI